MKPLLFVDAVCNAPYDLEMLNSRALGGTEATVIRVAEKLGEKYPVVVLQHNRRITIPSSGVTYAPFLHSSLHENWQAVVVLRHPHFALKFRAHQPNIPIWLWHHDLIFTEFLAFMKLFSQRDIGIVAVSDFLKQQVLNLEKIDPFLSPMPNIVRIYNPIDDDLVPNDTPYQPHQLAFISSPQKGLEYTLKVFKQLHERYPQFELAVTNPGYYPSDTKQLNIPGVKYLGNLAHKENIRVLRNALCLFYLNHVFPETFGLVLAEANAVGTPVLTHPLGAATEVIKNPEQLIDTYDQEAVIERVVSWHKGKRPIVRGADEYRLSNIAKQWESILF